MGLIGYGIDLGEHRKEDNFPGILEFIKKYTPDIYDEIMKDADFKDDEAEGITKYVINWFNDYEYDGEDGLHAYLAFVMSKEEDIVFESYYDGYGSRYVYIRAEMPWDYNEKIKSITKDEINGIFRKYISQISEKEYAPDNIYSYEE